MSVVRPALVWAGLVVVTLLSWWAGAHHPAGGDGARAVFALVLAVAFGKAWVVGREFMELRHAPVALRRAFDAWVLVFGVALGLLVLL